MFSRRPKHKRVRTTPQEDDRSSSSGEDLPDAPGEPEDTPAPQREYAQREYAQPIQAFIPGEGIETNCLMFYVGALIDKNAGIQIGPHWQVSHSMPLRRNG
jgi:hypothetical protein